ncbi:hypothetical protein KUTeg_005881, partial [Tegillarca granosa]
ECVKHFLDSDVYGVKRVSPQSVAITEDTLYIRNNVVGVSLQSVTITEDTVYILNNIVGKVMCKLDGNCGAISWYFPSITAAVATAFVGGTCFNTTSGYHQTCNDQNHQYTLYFTGTTNLHGQTLRCTGEVPVPSVSLEGISGQQITVKAGQSKSITCVTGASRPAPRFLWYIGVTNVTSLSTETQVPTQKLFYTRSTLTFIPTKTQNGLQVNCKAYNTDNNMIELTTKPTLNVQYPPDDANAVIKQGNTISTIEGNSSTLVCEVRGDGPVSISYQPEIMLYTRNEGENLGPIQCVSDCNPKCNFVWTRPGQSDYIGENLTISGITRTQGGESKCTASSSYGNGPDPVILTPSTNNYIVYETYQLGPIKCAATCKPACSYKWISPHQDVIQGDTLKINSIQRIQTGTYKCQAYNAVGTRNSNDVFVIVHFAANLTLMKISDGKPRAAKEPLQNRRNLKHDDFGTYILISNNTVNGPKEDVYLVGAKGKPQKPRDGHVMCIDYRSAVITWKPGFFNGDHQTFSVVYKEKGGTEQISVSNISDPGHDKYINHTVYFLQGAKTYIFTIYSRNTLGESPPLEVNCTTKG